MILPKKTKINYKNRTLKKKQFKNKFYKVTKRNNLIISKKKGGASPSKVNYSIGTNFYDCSGTGNKVTINKLSEKPTPEPTILETLDVEDYNEGDFIEYGNIFLFCKELKKDNVIFEIYNNKPDGKDAKFKVEKKPIEDEPGTEPEPKPGEGPEPGTEDETGGPKPEPEPEDQPGEEGPEPKPGPITTYYYDKLKLNDPKEGVGLDKRTIPLLNANMEKVLLKLDNYNKGDLEEDRKIQIETQDLANKKKKKMLPEEYLKEMNKISHGYEHETPTRALEEIIPCFYEGNTKKKDVAEAINQLKNKAELELKKTPK